VIMTTIQVARYLGICEKRVKRGWPGWTAYGIHPVRQDRRLLFSQSDIQKLKELKIYG